MPEPSCTSGKLCHRSQAAARRHAIRYQRTTGDRQAPYWCEQCRWWHLTTPLTGDMTPLAKRGTPTRRGTPPPPTTATVAELDAFLARHARGPRHEEQDT